jgi:hypothetical protein
MPEVKVHRTFWHGGQIDFEEVDGEFAVDVVELEFILILLIFRKVFRRKLPECVKVERAVFIDALADIEMLAVPPFDKDMPTEWAYESSDLKIGFILIEQKITDFAKELAVASGIVVEICVRGAATGAESIGRYRVVSPGFYRLQFLGVHGLVIAEQLLVVKFLHLFNYRKLVYSELIVLGACKIKLWKLKRYVFHNEEQQLANLCQ